MRDLNPRRAIYYAIIGNSRKGKAWNRGETNGEEKLRERGGRGRAVFRGPSLGDLGTPKYIMSSGPSWSVKAVE